MNGFFNSLKNLASGATGSAPRYEELEGETVSVNLSRMLMSSRVARAQRNQPHKTTYIHTRMQTTCELNARKLNSVKYCCRGA